MQPLHRAIRSPCPDVGGAADSLPARSPEVPAVDSRARRLFDGERAACQLHRHVRFATHGREHRLLAPGGLTQGVMGSLPPVTPPDTTSCLLLLCLSYFLVARTR